MHELAVCQALIEQVESVARDQNATRVSRILVHIGPLSGVEAPLLEQAFAIARSGTIAHDAVLEIEATEVRVHCSDCGAGSTVAPNRLVCARCGGYRTRLASGDEMVLARLELERAADDECDGADAGPSTNEESAHV